MKGELSMKEYRVQSANRINLLLSLLVIGSMAVPGSVICYPIYGESLSYCSYFTVASWMIFMGWQAVAVALVPIVVCIWGLVEKKPVFIQLSLSYGALSYFLLRITLHENAFYHAIENRCYMPFLPFFMIGLNLYLAFRSWRDWKKENSQ